MMKKDHYACYYGYGAIAEGDCHEVALGVMDYVGRHQDDVGFDFRLLTLVCDGELVGDLPGELAGFLECETEGGAVLVEVLGDGSLAKSEELEVWTGVVRRYVPVDVVAGCGWSLECFAGEMDGLEERDREFEAEVLLSREALKAGFVVDEKRRYSYLRDGRRYQVLTWSDVSHGGALLKRFL